MWDYDKKRSRGSATKRNWFTWNHPFRTYLPRFRDSCWNHYFLRRWNAPRTHWSLLVNLTSGKNRRPSSPYRSQSNSTFSFVCPCWIHRMALSNYDTIASFVTTYHLNIEKLSQKIPNKNNICFPLPNICAGTVELRSNGSNLLIRFQSALLSTPCNNV